MKRELHIYLDNVPTYTFSYQDLRVSVHALDRNGATLGPTFEVVDTENPSENSTKPVEWHTPGSVGPDWYAPIDVGPDWSAAEEALDEAELVAPHGAEDAAAHEVAETTTKSQIAGAVEDGHA